MNGFKSQYEKSTINSLFFCTEFIKNKTDISIFVTAALRDLSKNLIQLITKFWISSWTT